MSTGIEKLKQNAESNRVDISATGKHRNITPVDLSQKKTTEDSVDDRIEVDLTAEFDPEPKSEQIHESLAKDILEGENSPFAKYVAEKEKEYHERMATYEQEQEMKEEEEESSNGISLDEEVEEFGTESSYAGETAVLGEEDERKIELVDAEKKKVIQDIVIDKEDIHEIAESTEESEDVKTESVKEVKVEPVKEEVETPDIDLNITEVKASNDIEIIDEEEESTNEIDQDDMLKHLQKLATERLKPISQSLNISSFTVLKKPTANIKNLETEQVKAAKWVIPTQDSVVLMKEFLGSELESLREFSEDAASVSQLYRKYKTIYDHIVSPKPATYEAWLKSTPYSDIDHYFFAVYIASFKGANFIPLDCKEKGCEKTFLTEDLPIMKMVKFDTNEAKEKFVGLYESEATPAGKGIYCSEIVPLSRKIAIGFKDASVYSLFEIASLDAKDKDKYSSILEFIPYIDALYIIHEEDQTLEPVGYKIYPENANKTVKSKIATFFKVLKNLSVDEFTPIRSFVRSITTKNEGIRYVYPSVDCPHCGKPTKEVATTAEELVFTRYQLSALVNTSLK